MFKRATIVFVLGCIAGAGLLEYLKYTAHAPPALVALLPDGSRYHGDMVDGVLEGEGVLTWPNGNRYEGAFRGGLYNGMGYLQLSDGSSYRGEFVDGFRTGHGVYEFADQRRYEGEVHQGVIQGTGTLHFAEGVYTGQFSKGLYHGYGELKLSDDSVYAGQFVDGKFHGLGSYSMPDNGDYTGEFVEGVFTGKGSFQDGKGNRYIGEFNDWRPEGDGSSTDGEGNRYIGEFADGVLQGEGEFIGSNGDHYSGSFQYGIYSGEGKLVLANGDRYEGQFEFGRFQGQGELSYAEPLDGRASVSGRWRNGKLIEAEDPSLITDPKHIAETVLYNQHQLLETQWQQLEDSDPDRIDMYFLGIAGDGSQSVFRREINYVRDYFDRHYGTSGRSGVLINDRQTIEQSPLATNTSIERSLHYLAEKMDPERDILFIYLSSHGSDQFDLSLKQPGLSLGDLSAASLKQQLDALPVRWKVLMISACYSGGFIDQLADPNTLIITSAAEDRPSFGCSDRANFTWFGEAYFVDALPGADSFAGAFETAKQIIEQREQEQDYEASQPQIHAPEPVREQLARWRDQPLLRVGLRADDPG